RAGHHEMDAVEQLRRRAAEPEVDVRPRGRVELEARGILRVGDAYANAARREQLRDGSARAAEPDDERASRQVHQRSFSVESARSAQMMATIQKRTMICGSGQPRSSKWWWMGAIRKIRLRRSRNPTTWPITHTAPTSTPPP